MRAHLVIADIGGYTRYMNWHRLALSHAQQTIADLLTAVIDGGRPLFKLAKLEGDAAFFYAELDRKKDVDEQLQKQILKIRTAFLSKQKQLLTDNICGCEPCSTIASLKLKFAAHDGEAAIQKVKRYRELAGPDVILVHRMLKNEVPVSEYVLLTETSIKHLDEPMRAAVQSLSQQFEGFGNVTVHYLDFSRLPPPELPEFKASRARKAWLTMVRTARAVPTLLGFGEPPQSESHDHP